MEWPPRSKTKLLENVKHSAVPDQFAQQGPIVKKCLKSTTYRSRADVCTTTMKSNALKVAVISCSTDGNRTSMGISILVSCHWNRPSAHHHHTVPLHHASSKKGQATILWNTYPKMRLGLCILFENYPHINGPQKLKIFNKVFAVELAACGFPSGVPDKDYEKVMVQWRHRRKGSSAHLWRDITTNPSTDEGREEVKALKEKVKEAAAELGIAEQSDEPLNEESIESQA
ncbi:uncharacterized protein CLAFUR5_00182 [Fulvia fulva]|uniref:Uncharacterized protein n=1 Tax=Passalora fulva TaxID=5499 RepID=A0A9Q8P2B1_PASFU|nr:uncharacterized protein CLAFUR5_00182 [Fulvia fulva]KAK4638263.1 hypothetical protein CLAFUR0_00182 [Fulvia fulva]UJO10783.1 hypothetical protein CLAFUR5_00182 [Fulvia fulva]WPV23069.1 hypothetical protein CLAFUW7_00184 [Fulvia fulva]